MNRLAAGLLTSLSIHSGLFSQDPSIDRQVQYRPGDWTTWPSVRFVTSIALDYERVYFGTTNGIAVYNFYQNDWEPAVTWSDGLENDSIRDVLFDFKTGSLWCITEQGVSCREEASRRWINYRREETGQSVPISLGEGRTYLWLKGSAGITLVDRFTAVFRQSGEQESEADEVQWDNPSSTRSVSDFFLDPGYFTPEQNIIQDGHLRRYPVTTAFADRFQSLWIGTWGLGAAVADLKTLRLKFLPFGPYVADVEAMAWDGECMWIGGTGGDRETGAVSRWNMETGKWDYFESLLDPGLRSDAVTAVLPLDGEVWFGTRDGLARYDRRSGSWRTFGVHQNLWDDGITCLAAQDSVLWVGTQLGINRVLLKPMIIEQVRDPRLMRRMIYDLKPDGADVWAGTELGIFRRDAESGKWQPVPGYPGMAPLEVTAVSVYGDEVWFGTDDGVEMLDQASGVWKGFPAAHFPTDENMHVILADSQAVWAGTDNGVLKYNREEDRWRLFSTEDGLAGNSVRWILPDGDTIWFGTDRGLTRFYWNAPYRMD
jgi:hypothetical protein